MGDLAPESTRKLTNHKLTMKNWKKFGTEIEAAQKLNLADTIPGGR